MSTAPRPLFPSFLNLGGGAILRAARPEDAAAVFAVVDSNREHLRVWLPWVDGSQTAQDTRAFLEHDTELSAQGLGATYLIVDEGSLAGLAGLHNIDTVNRSLMIGYWLAKRCEGRGLVTRACDRLIEVAFHESGFERIVIRCAVGNTRSAAVPKRLGFAFEGIERHGQRWHNGFADLEIYSRLRGDR